MLANNLEMRFGCRIFVLSLPIRLQNEGEVFCQCKRQNELCQRQPNGFEYLSAAKRFTSTRVLLNDGIHLNTFGLGLMNGFINKKFFRP